jgi:murein DD-endopeptidase MepM/ murein hydrolase activator NlpD
LNYSEVILKNLLLIFFAFSLFHCQTPKSNYAVKYRLRIEKGDTLASIAEKYDTTWQSIAEMNSLGATPKLAPGQIIVVEPGPGGQRANLGITDPAFPDTPTMEAAHPSKRKGLLFGEGTEQMCLWPVQGRVASEFGNRGRRPHTGVDITAPSGAPIIAVSQGTVEFSGWKRGYGKTIILNHGTFKTLYAHCSTTHVAAKQTVRQGQEIANVGKTGNASGYHLHFEYLDSKNNPMDPRQILPSEALSRL